MTPRTLAASAVLLLLASFAPVANAQTEQRQLDAVLEALVSAWSRGDAAAIVALAARAGVSLDVTGETVGPLVQRQATAVLRGVIENRETVTLEAEGRIVGGAPARAAGELTWVTRPRDTTDVERRTVFVELVREADEWRVTFIRLLQ
ncbi:MAG TPA: hypothetical protein VNZ57_06220 [Longimicrobiales bacterium]|nr:hypothetical protein [Longimicrobiales bacterium]